MPTTSEQLAALNTRPATVKVVDERTDKVLRTFTVANRPTALALTVEPGTRHIIGVDMLDMA